LTLSWQDELIAGLTIRLCRSSLSILSNDSAVSPQVFTGAKIVCVVFPQEKPL
jgi:hypothetical protein